MTPYVPSLMTTALSVNQSACYLMLVPNLLEPLSTSSGNVGTVSFLFATVLDITYQASTSKATLVEPVESEQFS